MKEKNTLWKDPYYTFTDEQLEGFLTLLKEGVGEVKGHFNIGRYKYRAADVHFTVYEKSELNYMSQEELAAYFQRMEAETGIESYGEVVLREYNAHISFEVGNDDYLHLISIQLLEKGKGIGNKMIARMEELAKSLGFKGVLIRSTQSEAMNNLAIKRKYTPVYKTIEERVQFGIMQGFRYDTDAKIEYDNNGNLFGYYRLTF